MADALASSSSSAVGCSSAVEEESAAAPLLASASEGVGKLLLELVENMSLEIGVGVGVPRQRRAPSAAERRLRVAVAALKATLAQERLAKEELGLALAQMRYDAALTGAAAQQMKAECRQRDLELEVERLQRKAKFEQAWRTIVAWSLGDDDGFGGAGVGHQEGGRI